MYKALVADDHPLICAIVENILCNQEFKTVIKVHNGADAVSRARETSPDIIILDISMPSLDGLEVLRRLNNSGLKSKILIFTALSPRFFMSRCVKAGAFGYICKTDPPENLTRAIKALMSGFTFFPDETATSKHPLKIDEIDAASIIAKLSNRELLILRQISLGYSNKEIGNSMFLSNKTISAYKIRMFEKLQIGSPMALPELLKEHGLL